MLLMLLLEVVKKKKSDSRHNLLKIEKLRNSRTELSLINLLRKARSRENLPSNVCLQIEKTKKMR
jgi:hypothetical protein